VLFLDFLHLAAENEKLRTIGRKLTAENKTKNNGE